MAEEPATAPAPMASLLAAQAQLDEGDFQGALATVAAFLGMEFAIISAIDGDRYTVVHCHTPPDTLEVGQSFQLGQTACSITLRAKDVVAIDHMSSSPYRSHPCMSIFSLGSYIGAPLYVAGRLFGTVNFSSLQPSTRRWGEDDRQLLMVLSRMAGGAIERQQLAGSLRLARASLGQTSALFSQSASRIAHDLKAPLTNIAGLLYLLEGELSEETRDRVGRHLDSVWARTEKINTLIEAMMGWSRGGWCDTPEPTTLTAVVERCVARVSWPEGLRAETRTDAAELFTAVAPLERVLRQLIDNAIRHRDRPEGTVWLDAAARGEWAVFEVRDDGPGIPSRHLQRVLKAFKTLGTASAGAGLGLTQASELVALHGGELTLLSDGPGTTARFTWPLRSQPFDR